MKRATLAALLVTLFGLACFGTEFRGRVISAQGKPVAGALVVHRASGLKTLTGEDGWFLLDLPLKAKVTLQVSHPDYMAEELDFKAKSLEHPAVITLWPYIPQREEVVVTALRHPEPSTAIPAASTVVPTETIQRKMASNIAGTLDNMPGVTELGSGGFSLVPSIRGMARRRVLLLVDGARLSSDRRTGPSASFISPEDIGRIEVLRSPSSVFYGSDAIGGVVHILTREPGGEDRLQGRLNTRFGTVNQEKGGGLSLSGGPGSLGYYLSFQGVDAEDYRSPDASVFQSRYTQASFLGKIRHETEKRDISASFLLARGRNIGKPSSAGQAKPTWYPRENQNLLQVHWLEKDVWGGGDLSVQLFANPNYLETRTDTVASYKTKESFSRTESTDYGAQLSFVRPISSLFRLTAGLDWYGRGGAEAVNSDKLLDPQGEVVGTFEESPYTNGRRRDLGLFVSGDYTGIARLDVVAGLRLDFLESQANPGGRADVDRYENQAVTGFTAASFKLTDKLIFFANLSRAFRAPDLNELFYSGITGRGFIIANPDLIPESSLSFDGGLKIIARRSFIGLYGFSYEIRDMIERYRIAERTYTYDNIEQGRIRGVELEWEYFPWTGFSLFGNLAALEGKSLETGAPLNDIPPRRLNFGGRAWIGRLSLGIEGAWQGEKSDPGPAEIEIPSAVQVDFEASYFIRPGFQLYLLISNIFNQSYLARPDPESVAEPGRNLVLGVSCSF
jgi:outer membrane receptor protein involved in Fe transport